MLKLVTGRYGAKYETPKDLVFASSMASVNRPIAIPKNPARYPRIIYINLKILKVKPNEKSGIENEQIPVIAMIIIKIGLTKFALTAASP